MACTLRVASTRARFQQPEITGGFIPGGGGSVCLPRLIGPSHAAEAILTGRAFSGDEAFRVNWVNAVLPADSFPQEALRWAGAITQHVTRGASASR